MSTLLKRGDEVVVIAGSHRGKRGKILEVLPGKNRVVVEGVNMIKKHTKKSQNNQEGGIVEREGSLHRSNVMAATRFESRQAKRA